MARHEGILGTQFKSTKNQKIQKGKNKGSPVNP